VKTQGFADEPVLRHKMNKKANKKDLVNQYKSFVSQIFRF
jgi:hypothetical protein